MNIELKISSIIFMSFAFLFTECGNNKEPNTILASGNIESVDVTLSSKVTGQIKKIFVDEGARVKAGDLLLEVDHDVLDIQLRQNEAGVDFSKAQLQLLQNGARKEDIKAAGEQLNQTKINLDQAKTDRDRYEVLYNTNAVPKIQYDDAVTRYELTLSQYNAAKENYDKIKNITRPEEIESAKANLKKSIATVDLLKKNIEDCNVHSPIDGIIYKKYVEEGENVIPNTNLFKISNLQTVNLVVYLTEIEMTKIKLGQLADITIDAFKDKVYAGKIIYISPEAEFTPKNIQTQEERTKLVFGVKIEIPNPQYELKPGMPADAKILY
jgi:HlyD family secretion protein